MKKILTAMGNETLNRELMKYSKYGIIRTKFEVVRACASEVNR